MAELHVEAHTKEQAGTIAEMQAHHRHSSRAKFEVISIRAEGEPDPFLKELDKYRIV